ncbi:MAG: 6,7-dimethyl-8-ribityllumazine synthase [Bermanella sp.]|jgi:6,7-dimethyl-8-ribityllumazine synthase
MTMNQNSFYSADKVVKRDRIAFIQSCWHRDIVDQLRDSFLKQFASLNDRKIDTFEVPGAFEIPLFVKNLAESGKYAGIVVGGLVVDSGIYRHEFVATAVIDGIMKAQLDSGTPIFSAVLTPHDFISEGQPEFFKEHFITKGAEAANACAETLAALEKISQ